MSYIPLAIKQNGVVVGYATKSIDIVGSNIAMTTDDQGRIVLNIDTSRFVETSGASFTGNLVLNGGNLVVSNNETIDGRHVAADGQVLDAINSGTGFIARTGSGTFATRSLTGTANQIEIENGDGVSSSPTLKLPDFVKFPGTTGYRLPMGSTAQRPTNPELGTIRFNTDTVIPESFDGVNWVEYLSNADKRFYNPTMLIVKPDPGKDQFSRVCDAVDYIVSLPVQPSEDNVFLIKVFPGHYIANHTIMVPPYVHIVGEAQHAVVIDPLTPDMDIFHLTGRCSVNFLTINNAGPGHAAIVVPNMDDWALIHKIEMNENDIGIKMVANTGTSALYGEFVTINGGRYGLTTEISNDKSVFLNMDTFYLFPGIDGLSQIIGVDARGEKCRVNIRTFGFYGGEEPGVGLHVMDGAKVMASNGLFTEWDAGVELSDDGIAPHVTLVSTEFKDNVSYDLQVKHPGSTGSMFGVADRNKVTMNPLASFAITYSDPLHGGFISIGDLYLGSSPVTLTNVTSLITETAPMGLISGCEMTDGGGTVLNVAPGFGYVRDPANHVKRVDFAGGSVTLPPGSAIHVYIDHNGTLQTSLAEPSTLSNMLLARVLVGASSLLMIGDIPFRTNSNGNSVETYLRQTVGAVFVSGCSVSESTTTPRAINVTTGEYWYGTIRRRPGELTSPTILCGYATSLSPTGNVITSITQIPNTKYNPTAAQGLVDITPGYFVKHSLFITGTSTQTKVLMAYAKAEYATLEDAIAAPLAKPIFEPGSTPIMAAVIMQQGLNSIAKIIDLRPRHFTSGVIQSGGLGGGVQSHSDLLGLGSDDHEQYLLTAGTRPMAGPLDMNSNPITNVTTVNGVSISGHGSRHLPNGLDPIPTAAPTTPLSSTTGNTEGIANTFARSDHTHSVAGLQAASTVLDRVSAITGSGIVRRRLDGVWVAANNAVDLVNDVTGNLAVTSLNSGTNASVSTFWRGDGTWAVTDGVKSVGIVAPAQGITATGPVTTSGNITLALANDLAAVEGLSGAGLAVRTGTDAWATASIIGTANQIVVTNGNGSAGNPTISLAANPVIPGTGSLTLPAGTSAQRPSGNPGGFRFNTETNRIEFWNTSTLAWDNFPRLTGDAFTGNVSVAGTITARGTANNLVGSGSSAGSPVTVNATGTDANISINVVPKGTGTLQVNGSSVLTAASLNKVSQLPNDAGYLSENQAITLSGDVSGSGTTFIPVTLGNTGVVPGTYTTVTVDAKGRVTSGTVNGGIVGLYRGTVPPMSGTSQIFASNSAPSANSGTLVFTKTVTPLSTTADFVVTFTCLVDMSVAGAAVTMSLFRGSTCIGVALNESNKFGSQPTTINIYALDRANTLSPITYSVRIGVSSGTWYLGQTATANFGGINRSVWTIMEIN